MISVTELLQRFEGQLKERVFLRGCFNLCEERNKDLNDAEGFFSPTLNQAIIYAITSKGKRLRPLIAFSLGQSFRKNRSETQAINLTMPVAIAVEFIHTYSLVHDDLPAMDNDDFRRGRLSVHRQFDEATAILVGDALLTDAFLHASHSRFNAVAVVRELASVCGSRGLVAGQVEDLNPANKTKDSSVWLLINNAKTARLFEASAVVGALAVNANKEEISKARNFGCHVGRAFQIKDDLDDIAGLALNESNETLIARLHEHVRSAYDIACSLPNNELLFSLLHLAFAMRVSSPVITADKI